MGKKSKRNAGPSNVSLKDITDKATMQQIMEQAPPNSNTSRSDTSISQNMSASKAMKEYKKNKPFVSICTPTYNRRPFIKSIIKCFMHQDYPMDRMEWIILDDGTDKIEDLVTHIPQVKYFKYDEKMTLGKKRNLMHDKCSGDFIVYMDDDDYYPPKRVSHSVEMLISHPKALCAGSSEIYIYFKHIQKMFQFGPYGPNHATAGTFAFKKELLINNRYDDNASLAEEKAFLKNYTVNFVQLDPLKVILVVSHDHNTFDKKKLLDNQHPDYCKESPRTVDEFIKNPDLKHFYMNEIDDLLKDYEPGLPKYKPDVIKQIKEIELERSKMMQQQQQQQGQGQQNGGGKITCNQNGKEIELDNNQIVQILQNLQSTLNEKMQELATKDMQINELIEMNRDLQNKLKHVNKIIEVPKKVEEPVLVEEPVIHVLAIPDIEPVIPDIESQDPVKLSIVTESATSLNLSIEIK